LYKPIVKKWGFNKKTIIIAAVISSVFGLQMGAFAVVLETSISGVANLPVTTFVLFMQPIHLIIGIVEGIVTAAVLCFIYNIRPEILDGANNFDNPEKKSFRKVLITLTLITLLFAGIFSVFASQLPDGLEWSLEKIIGETELENPENVIHEAADHIVNSTAIMPDYEFAGNTEDSAFRVSAAGIIGSIITVALAGSIGFAVYLIKSQKQKNKNPTEIAEEN